VYAQSAHNAVPVYRLCNHSLTDDTHNEIPRSLLVIHADSTHILSLGGRSEAGYAICVRQALPTFVQYISFSTFCQIMELRWHIPRAFCNELDKATAISSVIQNALGHFVYRYVEEF
jgi:hypothetical protein